MTRASARKVAHPSERYHDGETQKAKRVVLWIRAIRNCKAGNGKHALCHRKTELRLLAEARAWRSCREKVAVVPPTGGFFFVNSGLILKADTESELAGVMAHEIAHVAARHGTRQATRGTLINYATIPLIFMGGWTGYAIRQGVGLAIPLGFLNFSRAFERDADFLGLQYLYKAGYDPGAFVDFFEKIQSLEKKKPGTISKVFSSHPMTDDRIKASQEEIQKVLKAKPEYVVNTSEYNDVKNRLAMLHNRRKLDTKEDANRPRLRRAPGSGTGPIDADEDGKKPKADQDERPTLKRREN
jgi:hypothetical protein